MKPFYLRLKDKAILIGDRDLYIKQGVLFIGEGPYVTRLFEGTDEQCQGFLDWILKQSESHYSFIDARPYLKKIESQPATIS